MRIIKQSMVLEQITPNALQLIEQAGRTCYKSEDRITDTSALAFVEMIDKVEHESVLEHAVATFRMITDRGVTHEIVRHRIASYSQESTRYCNYNKDKFGNELTIILPVWFYPEASDSLDPQRILQYQIWEESICQAEQHYFALINQGQKPQEARSVLPNSLKTEIVMTANFREWRHFFKLRCSPKAHPQMRELALQGLATMKKEVPLLFDKING
jgi:thymidylate synthase (FAD)